MGVGVAVGRRLLSVRQQLRQRCLSQSTKAAEEDRDLPGRVKLGTSPDKPRAQPCRPVWARVELCSRSQEDSHRKAGRKKKKEKQAGCGSQPTDHWLQNLSYRPGLCGQRTGRHDPCPRGTRDPVDGKGVMRTPRKELLEPCRPEE